MPELRPEVHVGDVGTQYRVRCYDEGGDFDPSDADTKELVFVLAGGGVTRKTASVETDGSPATKWYLTYTVQEDDGLGSPAGEFHPQAGKMKVQGFLEWADGRRFSSDIRSTDDDGRELRVYENLDEDQ